MPVRDRVRRPDPDGPSLDRAAELIAGATTPLVLAGNGAVRVRAAARLRELVDRTGMPVVATYMGKGAVSDRLPNSLMTLDSGPDGEAAAAVARADCVVVVGYDIAEHDPASLDRGADKRIVHVDHEPAEVYERYNPDVEVVADISATLRELSARVDATDGPAWCGDARARIVADATAPPDASEPFTVRRTLPLLRAAMADDDVPISAKQRAHTGESFGTRLGNPDFVRFAESFGIEAIRPESFEELATVLSDVIGDGDRSLVEVRLG